MADLPVSYRERDRALRPLVRKHRHAHDLTFGTVRWIGPRAPSTARNVGPTHDASSTTTPCRPPDRVAGLLLILYAQKIAAISQLAVDDVHFTGETVAITFGTSPVVLPVPLAILVRERIPNRRGKAKIGTPDDVPWLFPGGNQAPAQRQPDRPAAPQDRDSAPTGPLHRPVHPRRANSPPQSSPGCSASTSKSPSSGRRHPPGTGRLRRRR